jgi:methionyl aminopeptidase
MDESIMKPDYWQTGKPSREKSALLPWMIEVKTAEEIEKMKQAGKLARQVLDLAGRAVRPGITTDDIDSLVYNEIIQVNQDCIDGSPVVASTHPCPRYSLSLFFL